MQKGDSQRVFSEMPKDPLIDEKSTMGPEENKGSEMLVALSSHSINHMK